MTSPQFKWRLPRANLALKMARLALAASWPLLPTTPSHAITITVTAAANNETEHPTFDPNLSRLTEIVEAAAEYWENLILDNHNLDVTFGYLELGPSLLGVSEVQMSNGLGRPTVAAFALDTIVNGVTPMERNWYFDPTPFNDSEFDMQQVLVRDLTPQQESAYYNGSPPDLLEAGYWGNYDGANLGDDIFSVALHELGHILGVTNTLPGSAAELADDDYDFDPDFINGASAAAEIWDFPGDIQPEHLRSPEAVMSVGAGFGDRHLPGATDVFAAAAVAGWNSVDLYRKDFLGGTVWNLSQNWEGGRVPDSGDIVYVRHGGDVGLLLDSAAGNLIIRDGSDVETNDNTLTIAVKLTVEAGPSGDEATLTVEPNGLVIADELEINDGGNVLVSGSTITSRITADVVDINDGGVLIGHGRVAADALSNDGGITAINPIGDNAAALRLSATGGGSINLDGASGGGSVFAVLGNLDVFGPLTDSFDGNLTVGATRSVQFSQPWQIGQDGAQTLATVNLQGGVGAANSATIDGAPFTAHRGQLNVTGFGAVDAEATFDDDIAVNVAQNGVLSLNLPSTFNGGSYSGQGMIRFNADATIEDDTTMNVAFVDLDGASGGVETTLAAARLTLNVDGVDDPAGSKRFDGTINVNSIFSRLVVELGDPAASWQMDGVLNLNGSALPATLLGGSGVRVTGTLNVDGLVNVAANLDVDGAIVTEDATSALGLLTGSHVIRSGATVTGPGRLENRSPSTLVFEQGAAVAVDVENAGRLEPGVAAGVATINGDFVQEETGMLAIQLGGAMPGNQYDRLMVSGAATLGGGLEVSLIDGFAPELGQTFDIVQTGGVLAGTFNAAVLPNLPGLLGLDVAYLPNLVRLEVVELPTFPADFDEDGDVDAADLLEWQGDFGQNADSDADNDDDSDGADFLAWQQQLGSGAPAIGAAAVVPEPAAFSITASLAAWLIVRRRRLIV